MAEFDEKAQVDHHDRGGGNYKDTDGDGKLTHNEVRDLLGLVLAAAECRSAGLPSAARWAGARGRAPGDVWGSGGADGLRSSQGCDRGAGRGV